LDDSGIEVRFPAGTGGYFAVGKAYEPETDPSAAFNARLRMRKTVPSFLMRFNDVLK
jgi:hypothetical protein